jgi:hypothetical protein
MGKVRLVLTGLGLCCGFGVTIVGLSMLSAFGLAAIRPDNSLQVAGFSAALLLMLVWLTNGFPEREDICPHTRERIGVALGRIAKPLPDMARGP